MTDSKEVVMRFMLIVVMLGGCKGRKEEAAVSKQGSSTYEAFLSKKAAAKNVAAQARRDEEAAIERRIGELAAAPEPIYGKGKEPTLGNGLPIWACENRAAAYAFKHPGVVGVMDTSITADECMKTYTPEERTIYCTKIFHGKLWQTHDDERTDSTVLSAMKGACRRTLPK